MEQKDYLLREIEKMGVVLQAILNSLTGKGGNSAIALENGFEATSELLLSEADFDLKHFTELGEQASREYIARLKGMNTANCELLAEVLVESGKNETAEFKRVILNKALFLYEMSKSFDKTYSIEREKKIKEIESGMKPIG